MKKHTATKEKGGCKLCGAEIQGPWRYCDENCEWLYDAEQALAREAVTKELRAR